MKIVNSKAMALIDRQAQDEYHLPSIILMENAGIKACICIREEIFKGRLPAGKLTFLAGKGNNGGDALVMARQFLLTGASELSVILTAGWPGEQTDPWINLNIGRKLGIKIIDYRENPETALQEINHASWLFDGIAGTGLRGELNSSLTELIEKINAAPGKIIAIDVPSGLGDDFKAGYTCIQADYTVTMGLPKKCLYLPAGRIHCGRIHIIRIGFPPELVTNPAIPGNLLQPHDLDRLNPMIPPDTYKTRRGHLAVFAGSQGTSGAAWLSSTAAARSKIGLVSFFADEEIYPAVASAYSSVMIKKWQTGSNIDNIEQFSGFLAGPGWGLSARKQQWLAYLCATGKPCVIDADGLLLLAEICKKQAVNFNFKAILTPHPGEFSKLTGVPVPELLQNPVQYVDELSSRFNAVIVLKGHITYICSPEGEYCILDGMNPAMATAGTGDVLAGLISGFFAGGMSAFYAAQLGVLVHHLAGEMAYKQKGWFLAEDLVLCISEILKDTIHNG